VSALSVW